MSPAQTGFETKKFSVNLVGRTTLELRIDGVSETLECVEGIQLAIKLAVTHSEVVSKKYPSVNFGYGKIKATLTGKETFELSLALQIIAIPLGSEAIDGGWSSKFGQELLGILEKGAPQLAFSESIRAGREALNDLSSMTGKEHLAADELYKKLKEIFDYFERKKAQTRNWTKRCFEPAKKANWR